MNSVESPSLCAYASAAIASTTKSPKNSSATSENVKPSSSSFATAAIRCLSMLMELPPVASFGGDNGHERLALARAADYLSTDVQRLFTEQTAGHDGAVPPRLPQPRRDA